MAHEWLKDVVFGGVSQTDSGLAFSASVLDSLKLRLVTLGDDDLVYCIALMRSIAAYLDANEGPQAAAELGALAEECVAGIADKILNEEARKASALRKWAASASGSAATGPGGALGQLRPASPEPPQPMRVAVTRGLQAGVSQPATPPAAPDATPREVRPAHVKRVPAVKLRGSPTGKGSA